MFFFVENTCYYSQVVKVSVCDKEKVLLKKVKVQNYVWDIKGDTS